MINCPVCSSENVSRINVISYPNGSVFFSQKATFTSQPELWKCHRCKSRFTNGTISEEEAVHLYMSGNASTTWEHQPFHIEKPQQAVVAVSEILHQTSKVLDVGCANGELLDFAKDYGCQTFGLEYSEKSREILTQKGHLAFSSWDQVTEQFDLITAFDLVEHLYDLPVFLDQCAAALAPNGKIVILTGDANSLPSKFLGAKWWYVGIPEHIVFPSTQYFTQHEKYQVVDILKTYASSYLEHMPKKSHGLKWIIKNLILGKYNGFFSPFPDHYLLVMELKKRDNKIML